MPHKGMTYQEAKKEVATLQSAFNKRAIETGIFLLASGGIWFMAQDGRALDLNPKLEAQAVEQAKTQNLSPAKTRDAIADAGKLANSLEKIEWALGLNIAAIFGLFAAAKGGKLMAARQYLNTFAPRKDGQDGPGF
jgi:hypothetical protein